MADIESEILSRLQDGATINTLKLAAELNVAHQNVVGAVKSLQGDLYVDATVGQTSSWKLSTEAMDIEKNGSPEFLLWAALAAGPSSQDDLVKALGKETVANGLKNGMKEKVLVVTKQEGVTMVARHADKASDFTDSAQGILQAMGSNQHVDPADTEAMKKRKLVTLETIKFYDITKGAEYAPVRRKLAADLTKQMLQDGSWATEKFKGLNYNAQGREPVGGHLHPLLKVRQEFREIFLELGFAEMETQQWVENSFWNFDTLFVPQKHPARDAQDTFFISKPAAAKAPAADYMQRVKDTHVEGYKCDWSEEETHRNVLRTHTTSVSSWTLYNLAQAAPLCPTTGKRLFKPGRYFSIDRVFRNEEMDKTHLCEFHQVEGFIVDRNLSLANMMHVLEQFFRRIGVTNLRFKPAYNPYTEPSMEIFGYHAGMKKWMEVGNSGVFRPEMLQPMGFDKDVTAIAWGLSLERPTMIKYGIQHISELFGHKVDLNFIRKARIARY